EVIASPRGHQFCGSGLVLDVEYGDFFWRVLRKLAVLVPVFGDVYQFGVSHLSGGVSVFAFGAPESVFRQIGVNAAFYACWFNLIDAFDVIEDGLPYQLSIIARSRGCGCEANYKCQDQTKWNQSLHDLDLLAELF